MTQSQKQYTGGHNDPADAVVSEGIALWGGIAATVAIGVPLAIIGVFKVLHIAGQLVWLAIALYLIGGIVQYWTAQSYKDGLTVKELLKAVAWPVDMYQTIRAGVNRQNLAAGWKNATTHAQTDNSTTLLDEQLALWVGVGVTVVVGVPLVIVAISSVLGLLGQLVWLAIAVYAVGLFVQYWTSKAYLDGLTTGEILLAVAWPIDTLRTIRAGVKARRQATP